MEIAVCIKQVPGTSAVEVDPVTGVLQRDGIDAKMNPYDLYALETALRIREERGGSILALTMGPPQAEAVLKESFMMGADEGVLLSDRRFAGSDVLATAYTLSRGLRVAGVFQLILCGKQTTDGDTAQVGAEIAEFLGIPHITNVRTILEMTEESITLETDLPHAVEVVRVQFPCLLAVDKDIYQPRLPSYLLKKKTADRPITILGFDDLNEGHPERFGLTGSPTQVKRIFPPEVRDNHELLQGTGELLADRLYEKLSAEKFLQD